MLNRKARGVGLILVTSCRKFEGLSLLGNYADFTGSAIWKSKLANIAQDLNIQQFYCENIRSSKINRLFILFINPCLDITLSFVAN